MVSYTDYHFGIRNDLGGGELKIGRQDQRSSAISTSNEATILVRGRDLARDLIGKISFSEHFWLLVTGALPTAGQLRVLDATLVAIAEHGLVPSVQVSRMTLAAAPEALQGAVAAGILGCGSVVLGSSESAGRFRAQSGYLRWRSRRGPPDSTPPLPGSLSGCCRKSSGDRWRSMSPGRSRRCCWMPGIRSWL